MTLQAALKEQEIKNPFKTPKDNKVNIQTIINGLVTGIETLLNIITIASQNKRENNQENLSSQDNNTTPLLNKGKAKNNKL